MMPVHHCHALNCKNRCPPKHLMCGPCWALVPPNLQARVYATVKRRDPHAVDETWAPWWRASHEAIAHVAKLKYPQWDPKPYLERQMKTADDLEKRGVIVETRNAAKETR